MVTCVKREKYIIKGRKTMNLSARNKLTGKIIDVNKGAVNGVVKVELPNGMIVTSTISLAAIEELELEVGKEATAVIKATSVMMG